MAGAQITKADLKRLEAKEDSLAIYAKNMIVDSSTAGRMRSDSLLIRTLVRSLQIKNSFYFTFKDVIGISKLYSPDSLFRIFTWTLSFDQYYGRQRGAIQMRTDDGSLKLIPLTDISEFTENALDSVRTRSNWIGATYYGISETSFRDQKYYTLFGIDNGQIMATRKWIEVMTFNRNGEPVFGGPFFSYEEDSLPRPTQYRYMMEYKKDASVFMRFDPEMQIIVFDHLISETNEPDNRWTYIPDGDYEGFKWRNGRWIHIDKIYNSKLEDGQAPVEKPILDDKGRVNETILQQQSEKNKLKKPGGGN